MEKLQQDSDKSLHVHQKELMGALAAAMEGLDGPKSGASGPAPVADQMSSEVMMAASGVGVVASVAASVHEDLTSSKPASGSMFTNTSRKQQNSLFVGGGQANPKAARRSTLVPMSYGDKKAAAKIDRKAPARPLAGAPAARGGAARTQVSVRGRDTDIFARTTIASMSLTGASLTGARPAPPRGVVATAKAARLKEMQDEMAYLKRVMSAPYAHGSKRLIEDYKNGVDAAEQFVQNSKPDLLKNVAPKLMADMQPKAPTGR